MPANRATCVPWFVQPIRFALNVDLLSSRRSGYQLLAVVASMMECCSVVRRRSLLSSWVYSAR
jgi:hypothetical protein